MGVSIDFTSPLPFSATAKKSSFKPIRFNQKKRLSESEAAETSQKSQTLSVSQPPADTVSLETEGLNKSNVPDVEEGSSLFPPPSQNDTPFIPPQPIDAQTPEAESLCEPSTVDLTEDSSLNAANETDGPELEPDSSIVEPENEPTPETVDSEVVPEVTETSEPQNVPTNEADQCLEVIEESLPVSTSTYDDKSTGVVLDISAEPLVSVKDVPDPVPIETAAEPTYNATSSPVLVRLNVEESCDSVTSDGAEERPYTDDDIDDTESVENFLDSTTAVKSDAVPVDTVNSSEPTQPNHSVADSSDNPSPACTTNAITDSNLLDNEGIS